MIFFFLFLIKGYVPQKTCVWDENNKQILRTNAWQVIEMDFESDVDIFKWGILFFCTTMLLLILPWHWRASWRKDAWWTSVTHGIQLNTHRPPFSIPWSKNRPQSKKLLGRRLQREYNCQIKCTSFEWLQRLFVPLLWIYQKTVLQSREIRLIEKKKIHFLFLSSVCALIELFSRNLQFNVLSDFHLTTFKS